MRSMVGGGSPSHHAAEAYAAMNSFQRVTM